MASRLKSAGLVMICGCIAVAVLLRFWHPEHMLWWESTSPLRPQIRAAALEAENAKSLYADYVVMDSLLPRIPAATGVFIDQSPMAMESSDALRKLVDDELRGVTEVKARIAVFVVDPLFGKAGTFDFYSQTPPARAYYTGVDKTGPYCAAVIRMSPKHDPMGRHPTGLQYNTVRQGPGYYIQKSQPLGPCVLWAKHGAPGPAINKWLNEGGYHFALSDASVVWNRWPPDRQGFGMRWNDGTPIDEEACLAGRTNRCVPAITRNILRPERRQLAAYNSNTANDYYGGRFGMYGADVGLLAFIENSFGAPKFEQFWKSAESPEHAFQSAFSVPMASWIQDWAQTYIGKIQASPRMSVMTILLTFLALAFFIYVAIRFTQDRQIQ